MYIMKTTPLPTFNLPTLALGIHFHIYPDSQFRLWASSAQYYQTCMYYTNLQYRLSPTAQITARYWSSSTDEFVTTNSFSGSSFVLSHDKCSCQINAQNKMMLESSLANIPKYFVSAFPQRANMGMTLSFESKSPITQIKSGRTMMKLPSANAPQSVWHRFIPIGQVTSTIQNGDGRSKQLNGYATYLHGIQSSKPHVISTRWDMFQHLDGPSLSALIMLQFKTPGHFSKQAITQALYVRDGKVVCCTTKASARHLTSEIDSGSSYPIPKTIEYKWEGRTVDGDSFKAASEVTSGTMIARWDILSTLPFLLRKLLQALIAKPFTFHWLDRVKATVEVGSETRVLEGMTFHETTYVNME
jgi:hypothetical protein